MDKVKSEKPKVKSTSKNLKVFFYWFIIVFLAIFLLLNIFASQQISSIYFQLINNNRKATVEFLKRIRNLPMFNFYLTTNTSIYGQRLENQVFQQERAEEEQVAQLEQLLKKNPKSRDVIYNLYLLNKDLNNTQQAEKYLKMAKEIDPDIK